jgi:hypothetical protein
MLVTGGVINETQLTLFIGTSIHFPDALAGNRETTTVFVLNNKTNFILQERSLRNRIKSPASYQWAVISKRFKGKGFSTINPLEIRNSGNKNANLISFTLKCISNDIYTVNDHKQMIALVAEISFPLALEWTRIKKVTVLKKKPVKDAPHYDMSVINTLMAFEKKHRQVS